MTIELYSTSPHAELTHYLVQRVEGDGEMEAANLIALESSERDFRKAAKLLASMLEPTSGKVAKLVRDQVNYNFPL